MSFCKNCGIQLPDGVSFCPNCGSRLGDVTPEMPVQQEVPFSAAEPSVPTGSAELPEMEPLTRPSDAAEPFAAPEGGTFSTDAVPETAPVQKKKLGGKAVAAVIAACCAVAVLAAVLAVCVFGNTPERLIAKAFSRTASDLEPKQDKDLFENGSVTVSADLNNWGLDAFGIDELPLKVMMKLCFGGEDYESVQLRAESDGEALVDLSVYQDQKTVAFRCDPLLPEYYGTDLTKLKERLPNSVFAPGGAYDIGEEFYDALMQSLEQGITENDLKQLTEVFGRYGQLLLKAACKEGDAKKNAVELTAGTETIRTTAVTLTLDANALANVLTEVYETFIEDEELRALITKYAAIAGDNSVIGEYVSAEDVVDELYTDMLKRENFDAAMQELREEDILLTPVFYVAKSNKHLAAFEMNVRVDGEGGDIRLILGEDLRTSKYNSLQIAGDGIDAELTRYVSEDTAEAYKTKLIAKEDGESIFTAEYKLDRTKGLFTITVDDGWDKVEISGTQSTTDKVFELAVNKIIVGNESLTVDLRITVNRDEPAVKAPEYKDILSVSESEIDRIVSDIEESVDRLGDEVSDIFSAYSGYGNIPSTESGAGGDIVGNWAFGIEGFEDALYFNFFEDGTVIVGTYDEYQAFEYVTDDGMVYLTDEYGYTEIFAYTVEGDTLYMTIEGETMEFIRR